MSIPGLPVVIALHLFAGATRVSQTPPVPDTAASTQPGLPSVAAPFTLAEAIRLARDQAPRRRATAERVGAAERAAAAAGVSPNPLVEARAENWQFGGRSASEPSLDGFLVLTQPIELGGKRAARRGVAGAAAALAGADLQASERDVMLSAAHAYVAAVRARGLTELLGAQRQSGSEVISIVRRRVEEGVAPEADLRKFETEVARVDAQLVRAWLELSRACAALGAQLGLPGDVDPSRLVEPAPVPPPSGDVSALARDAAARRPSVIAATRRLEETRAMLRLERARRIPDLAVSAGYKRTGGVNTGVAAVLVPLPLSDRNAPAIARAEGEARAAALELEAAAREARIEIEAELRAAAALAERANELQQTLIEPAAIVRLAARSAFREGSGDILGLVDADRVFVEAQRDALELRLEAALASVGARLSLGEQMP